MNDRTLEKTRIMGANEVPVRIEAPPEHDNSPPAWSPVQAALLGAAASMAVVIICAVGPIIGFLAREHVQDTGVASVSEDVASTSERTVAVLGIESIDFDDRLARELTQELRHAVGTHRGWRTHPTRATILGLTIAFECDPRTMRCLERMATELGTDRLVFGYMHRVNPLDGREQNTFRYELFSYDVEAGDIVAITEGNLAISEYSFEELAQVADDSSVVLLDEVDGEEAHASDP
ncbi:hypothetical protein IT407_01255 [Candidatus Uhrbacteria bacterium]|nr:hypothetical protein [Candidatus Uhrbacteria bacterium]